MSKNFDSSFATIPYPLFKQCLIMDEIHPASQFIVQSQRYLTSSNLYAYYLNVVFTSATDSILFITLFTR